MNEVDIFSIKNMVIIITGAGRGIGRTFAVNMAKISAYVYCFDINFPTKIPDALSDNLFDIKCDLTNTKKFDMECKKIFARHEGFFKSYSYSTGTDSHASIRRCQILRGRG